MARRKAKLAVTEVQRIDLQINGSGLSGTDTGDGWTFECQTWPDLAGPVPPGCKYTDIVGEFTRRCLQPAITVKGLAHGR